MVGERTGMTAKVVEGRGVEGDKNWIAGIEVEERVIGIKRAYKDQEKGENPSIAILFSIFLRIHIYIYVSKRLLVLRLFLFRMTSFLVMGKGRRKTFSL